MSPYEAVRRVRDEFLSNVALHLRSDVPVGAALSGGIDSSAIVAAIRHLEPDREIHTFTHVVDDPVLGEERWADVIASATGARAHKVRPRPDDLVEDLDELTWFQDLPVQGTSAYAQYRVFRLAREAGITVLLDGQGADEILGGYPLFRAARLASLVRSGDARAAVGLLRCLDGPGPRVNLARRALADYLVPRWITESARRGLGLEWRPAWIDEEWLSSRGARREAFHLGFGGTCVSAESVRCLTSLSLPDFLRFEDRNSMAHSRESRLPFLTPGFVNLALSLPGEYIVDERGVSKSIFRKAMRGIVPDAILDRRDKVGFATPESRWLTALRPWVEHVIAAPGSRIPALRLDALSARWRSVFEGRAPFDSTLWWALALIVWCRRFDVEFE
jgi:asparagine synthase (glutamine-hydrolysing)